MTEYEWKMSGQASHVSSTISVSTYIFTWSIENISKWGLNTSLTSPKFHPESDQVFYATLHLTTVNPNNYYYLTFHQESGSDVSVQHDISIMDCMDRVFYKYRVSHKYQTGAKSFPRSWLVSKIEEFNNESKNNILIFKCAMELSKFTTESNLQKYHPKSVSALDNLSALSEDLKAIYASSSHADITLRVDGGIMQVHKTLLCARSPVFAKMFEAPMDESLNNTVDIPDLQLPVLKDMMAFLYSGTLSSSDFESVYALYYAADKYDVPSLRNTCIDVLLSKLDITNACSVLILAEQHSNDEFKKSVMDFIEYNFDKILATDVWDAFFADQTQLAMEVIVIHSKKYKILNELKSEN